MKKIEVKLERSEIIESFLNFKDFYFIKTNVSAIEKLLKMVSDQEKKINLLSHTLKVNELRFKSRGSIF